MKINALVARLAILTVPVIACAEEFQSGDFIFRTLGTPVVAVEVAGYTGPDGAVTIPGMAGGLPVTGIGEAAFTSSWRMTSVIIPDGVRIIGDRAFSWCSDLAVVSLPDTLTSIGDQAFQVTSLLSVTLPNSLTNIGEEAFYACDLNTLSLPASVLRIGDRAFRYCSGLSNITVAAENPAFKSEEGVLFDRSGRTLMVFPIKRFGQYGHGAYEIPPGTTHIAPSAFEGCWGLTNVLVPDTVTHIGEAAFASSHLIELVIPESVSSIGDRAFCECSSLTYLSLPSGLTSIGAESLANCTGLTSINLPAGLTHLGTKALFACWGLTNLVLPEALRTIGEQALSGCSKLTNLVIPARVESIGKLAFHDCYNLLSIEVAPSNTWFSSAEGVLMDKDQSSLLAFPEGRTGGYVVSNRVTRIGAGAFAGSRLTEVDIPAGVTLIGEGAFSMCGHLQSIRFHGDAPSLPGGYYNTFARVKATSYQLPGTVGWEKWVLPAAPWVLPYPVILPTPSSLGIHPNGFGFKVSWATNASLVVEIGRALEDPGWTPATTHTLTAGWFHFTDSEWTNHPSRLYRVRTL